MNSIYGITIYYSKDYRVMSKQLAEVQCYEIMFWLGMYNEYVAVEGCVHLRGAGRAQLSGRSGGRACDVCGRPRYVIH